LRAGRDDERRWVLRDTFRLVAAGVIIRTPVALDGAHLEPLRSIRVADRTRAPAEPPL
jgi:hypothetical protein